ncbi:MAG TPA: MFS transporter [Planctomycetes bacterium]|nr:MFS transporter [Planctomycetota bacterium]HIN79686.1 MFS transporter [Planctomycetota bacterium]
MSRIEKSTYRRHRLASIPEGMFGSMMWAAGEFTRKALGADILLLTLTTMAPAVVQGAILFFSRWISSTGPRRLLRRAATVGRLPLVLILLLAIPEVADWASEGTGQTVVGYSFLLLITISALAQVPITAAWNGVLRANYRDANRGELFGRAHRYGSFASAATLLVAGIWLHQNEGAFPWIYAGAAVCGWLACEIFAGVELRDPEKAKPRGLAIDSARAIWKLLLADRRFLRYELGFILYGTAFMASMTAKPVWTVDAEFLHLDWRVLLGSKALVAIVAVFLAVWFGRKMDRIGPGWLSGFCFIGLAIYGIALSLASTPGQFLFAEAIFGVSMAGVMIAWNMGPVAFAREEQARQYMAVHVALVCIRGVVGHTLGGGIVAYWHDPRIVFGLSVGIWLVAAWVMFGLGRGPELRQK